MALTYVICDLTIFLLFKILIVSSLNLQMQPENLDGYLDTNRCFVLKTISLQVDSLNDQQGTLRIYFNTYPYEVFIFV